MFKEGEILVLSKCQRCVFLSFDSHQSTTIISYLKILTRVLAIPHGTHDDVEMMLACISQKTQHNTRVRWRLANRKAQPPNDNNTWLMFIDGNGEKDINLFLVLSINYGVQARAFIAIEHMSVKWTIWCSNFKRWPSKILLEVQWLEGPALRPHWTTRWLD